MLINDYTAIIMSVFSKAEKSSLKNPRYNDSLSSFVKNYTGNHKEIKWILYFDTKLCALREKKGARAVYMPVVDQDDKKLTNILT